MRRNVIYPLWGIALLLVGLLLGMNLRENESPSEDPRSYLENLEKFQDVVRYLNANYFEEIDNDKLIENAITGMLEKLDPHTYYIPEEELRAMAEQMQGSFDGIGIEFNIVNDTLFVVTPLVGGPSEEVGLLAGDRIVRVDGQVIAGTGITNSDVLRLLKGPKGTQVTVGVMRRGVKDELSFTITRDAIPIHSVDFHYMPQPTVGYIKVTRFAETTYDEFHAALEDLKTQGMKSLILDLRSNPGGYMEIANEMADEFLEKGRLVVYTDGRIPQSKQRYIATSRFNGFEKGALIILIDEGSASASEIVSGAVQDWDRGLLIGTRSFGKGLVQLQHDLNDGSAVRVVISRYFTPSGRSIQKPFEGKSSEEYDAEVWRRYQTGEIYDASKMEVPDSLLFRTKRSGRAVYGGGGIMPDVFVPDDTTHFSRYLAQLFNSGLMRSFAIEYVDRNSRLKTAYKDGFAFAKEFEVTEAMLKELVAFGEKNGIGYNSQEYTQSLPLIKNLLKSQIGHAAYGNEAQRPTLHQMDPQFRRALELIPAAQELEEKGTLSLEGTKGHSQNR